MAWYVPVFLRILVANVIHPSVSKHVVIKHSLQKRHLLNFSFCSLVAITVAATYGQLTMTATTLFIFCVGVANGWASYCQWKAQGISLSRNSLFTFWDDIIAMSLSYYLLNEGQFLNFQGKLGIVLSVTAVSLLAFHDYRKKDGVGGKVPGRFYYYVGLYSVIWGVATFLMRKWGVEKVPISTFLASWYTGAWFGSLSIFLCFKKFYPQSTPSPPFTLKDFAFVAIMGSSIMVALALVYLSYERVPQTVVQPIFLVSEMALPALIGLFGFGERQGLKFVDWLLITIGISGGVLAGLSYRT